MNHLLFKRHRTHTAFKRADAIRMHRLSAREQRVEDQMISRLVEEMDKEQRREFLIQLTNRMQEGQHWQTAAAAVGIQTSQSTAYRLLQSVRKQGEVALQDGRHGHA